LSRTAPRPGDVLPSGAVVSTLPGQAVVSGRVLIPRSRRRRAERHGWAMSDIVALQPDGTPHADSVVMQRGAPHAPVFTSFRT
jgi:hypothetical protein